jgi:hypothetical protein
MPRGRRLRGPTAKRTRSHARPEAAHFAGGFICPRDLRGRLSRLWTFLGAPVPSERRAADVITIRIEPELRAKAHKTTSEV